MELPIKGEKVPFPKIKEICEFYGLNDLWIKIEEDPPAKPFKSDGCSIWFDSWEGISMYPACFLHDLKYWAGYPDEDVERLVADAELMIDVARLLGKTKMAETMFHGVRVGGHEIFKRSFSFSQSFNVRKVRLMITKFARLEFELFTKPSKSDFLRVYQ
ncbi:MAG: hypothetical protein JRJ62_02745 [Deltaproteobacteria bacterium]|nr:hypothetical protein [Deltaproteobacteria bacterium]